MRAPLLVVALAGALLLAGCLETARPATTKTGPVITTGNRTVDEPVVPGSAAQNLTRGFDLRGNTSTGSFAHPDNVTATFTITNVGADTMRHGDLCDSPWELQVTDAAGARVEATAPVYRCMAMAQPVPFHANETLNATLVWNGTLYHESGYRFAPAGQYHLVATFTAYRDGNATRVSLALPVRVLANVA